MPSLSTRGPLDPGPDDRETALAARWRRLRLVERFTLLRENPGRASIPQPMRNTILLLMYGAGARLFRPRATITRQSLSANAS